MQVIPPCQHRGRNEGGHDAASSGASARSSPDRERHQGQAQQDKARGQGDEWKSEGRQIDGRHSEDSEEDDRRGDSGWHGEESAQRFPFRRGERLRRLIAPRHEWIQTREECRARGRGEDRAPTNR